MSALSSSSALSTQIFAPVLKPSSTSDVLKESLRDSSKERIEKSDRSIKDSDTIKNPKEISDTEDTSKIEKDSFEEWLLESTIPTQAAPLSLESTLNFTLQTVAPLLTALPAQTPQNKGDLPQSALPLPALTQDSKPLTLTTNISGVATTSEVSPALITQEDYNPAALKKIIDGLNEQAQSKGLSLALVPSDGNKDLLKGMLLSGQNPMADDSAFANLLQNAQTRKNQNPQGVQIFTPTKGLELRLQNTNALNLYEMSDANFAEALPAKTLADTKAANVQTAQNIKSENVDLPNISSALSSSAGLQISGGTLQNSSLLTPQNLILQPSNNTLFSPQLLNSSPLVPQAAAQNVAAMAQKIHKNSSEGRHEISLRLDPLNLGRMDVRMEYKKGDPLKVHVVVEKADSLNFLAKDQHILEQAFSNAGLKSQDVVLSFEHNQNAFSDNLNGSSNQSQNGFEGFKNSNPQSAETLENLNVQNSLEPYIDPRTGRIHYNILV